MAIFTKKERSEDKKFNEWLKSTEFVNEEGVTINPELKESDDEGEDEEKE